MVVEDSCLSHPIQVFYTCVTGLEFDVNLLGIGIGLPKRHWIGIGHTLLKHITTNLLAESSYNKTSLLGSCLGFTNAFEEEEGEEEEEEEEEE